VTIYFLVQFFFFKVLFFRTVKYYFKCFIWPSGSLNRLVLYLSFFRNTTL